jgi:hypothetical protein
MRRVNTRGLKQANKCMLMSAVAYNLKKLMKWKETKLQTTILSLKKAGKSLCFFFLFVGQLLDGPVIKTEMLLSKT